MKKGFTLVEMLVVISILSIFGILILTIFTRSLRSSNKSQIIGVIKQNGQAVLENMDKIIRNADNVVCPFVNPDGTRSTTLVVVKNGIYTRFRFRNGLIEQDNPRKQDVKDSRPVREETDTELVNRICHINDIALSPITLTDTNPQTGVSVENGSFVRDRAAGFQDQVTIGFAIKPGVDAPPAIAGQIDPVTFQTTVQLR